MQSVSPKNRCSSNGDGAVWDATQLFAVLNAFFYHRKTNCGAVREVRNKVAVADLGSESWFTWALLTSGFSPLPFDDLNKCSDAPGVVCIFVGPAVVAVGSRRPNALFIYAALTCQSLPRLAS